MRAYLPGVPAYRIGEWHVGSPGNNLVVVKRVGHAKYIGGSVLCIVIDSSCGEVATAARLEINPENAQFALLSISLRAPPMSCPAPCSADRQVTRAAYATGCWCNYLGSLASVRTRLA